MRSRPRLLSIVCALGLLGAAAGTSPAALSKASGGSGYSGELSKNKAIRKQQLICDPSAPAATNPGPTPGVVEPDAPLSGSTSVTYDPRTVSLSGLLAGPSYSVQGQVAVDTGEGVLLQDIGSFLEQPFGREVGYVQVSYGRSVSIGTLSGTLSASSLTSGTPGQMSPPSGYTTIDHDGVKGFDTHAFFFDYLEGVPDAKVAKYNIFAATEGQFYGNQADSLFGLDANGKPFTLGPGQLSPATVSGSLAASAVPLPPAAWAGLSTLAGMATVAAARRRTKPAA